MIFGLRWICFTSSAIQDNSIAIFRVKYWQNGRWVPLCVALELHFFNTQILLMLLSAGVWCMHWESLGKANKQPPPHPHVTARRSQVHPKIGRFVGVEAKMRENLRQKLFTNWGVVAGYREHHPSVSCSAERGICFTFTLTALFQQTIKHVGQSH